LKAEHQRFLCSDDVISMGDNIKSIQTKLHYFLVKRLV